MTGRTDAASGIDPVGTAGALGAIAGLASLAWPFFDGMAASLVALAIAGWVGRIVPGLRGSVRRAPTGRAVLGLVVGIVALGWAYFLLAPGEWALGRGVAIGIAGALVGWAGRRPAAFGEGGP